MDTKPSHGNLPSLPPVPLDPARTDPLLQFILAVAGQQDDPRSHQLGPIHLLKYAYLADLAYATTTGGQTYTGASWQFYDFGPWSPPVLERLEPALAAAGAVRNVLPSPRYGDYIRYSLEDEPLLDRLDSRLPGPIVSAVRWAVREFGADTPALLRHVYMTSPMLNAAPGEQLVFHGMATGPGAPVVAERGEDAEKRAKNQRKKIASKLRDEVRRRLSERRSVPAVAVPPPRYDEVFFDGIAWLDEQAGEPVPLSAGELAFSPDIWTSRGRTESGEDGS